MWVILTYSNSELNGAEMGLHLTPPAVLHRLMAATEGGASMIYIYITNNSVFSSHHSLIVEAEKVTEMLDLCSELMQI
jgi:hypothetical protein